jgi:hypothetical protein
VWLHCYRSSVAAIIIRLAQRNRSVDAHSNYFGDEDDRFELLTHVCASTTSQLAMLDEIKMTERARLCSAGEKCEKLM